MKPPIEHVDPPSTVLGGAGPDPRRTTYAGEPDKSFRFTRPRRERLLMLLRATLPLNRCCERIGCDQETPIRWREKGRAARDAHERGEELDELAREQMEFAQLYDEAITQAETELMALVQRGAKTDWRAAAWRLACLRPSEYSERWQVKSLQLEAEAPVRKAEQDGKELQASLLREKLDQIREARHNGGQVLVIGADDLVAWLVSTEDLPADLREKLVEVLNKGGFKFVEARDLGAPPAGGG